MSDFKVIETQEQFDEIIKGRLEREREKAIKETEEKYADYDVLKGKNTDMQKQLDDLNKELTENKDKIAAHDKEVADLNSKIAQHERDSVKIKVANEMGIPYELASKLTGDDEEAIRADAKTFAAFIQKKPSAPGYNPELPPGGEKEQALKRMSQELFKD